MALRVADHAPMNVAACFSRLVDLAVPPSCALCGLAVAGRRVCAPCAAELPWIADACPGCAMPLPVPSDSDLECASCQKRPPATRRVIAPLDYAFPVDALIKGLKFRYRVWLAPALAELLLASLEAASLDFDVLVPMPLHRWRHAARGFNQADEIARALKSMTGIPVSRCLRRRRATRAQTGLDAKARRKNLAGAFEARMTVDVRHALLVDDVVTTGETGRAAARALLRAGVPQVSLLAVARAT